jgi:type IV secretory pathway protease TraF
MVPTLRPGDIIIVRYRGLVGSGSLVLARFPDGVLTVKRAVHRRTDRLGAAAWWLVSDNSAEGVDSRHRGPIAEERIAATVLGRLWPRPGRLGKASANR